MLQKNHNITVTPLKTAPVTTLEPVYKLRLASGAVPKEQQPDSIKSTQAE